MTDIEALIERNQSAVAFWGDDPREKDCAQLAKDNVQALSDLKAENERLNLRLETEPEWGEDADGIACRDDTIKLLDERIARLKASGNALAEANAKARERGEWQDIAITPDNDFVQAIRSAARMYSDAELAVWLNAPQPLLQNWTPIQLLGCGKSSELLAVMQALDEGVYL